MDCIFCLAQFGEELRRIRDGGTPTDDTSYIIKKTIRAFTTQVDGLSFALRGGAVACADERGLVLTHRVLAKLTEKKYDAKTDAVLDQPKFLSTLPSLELALRHYPELLGSSYELDKSGVEWRAFKRLIKVRNHLTHPKRIEDLSPVNALYILRPTILWFSGQINSLFADIAARIGVTLSLPPPAPAPFADYRDRCHTPGCPVKTIREAFGGPLYVGNLRNSAGTADTSSPNRRRFSRSISVECYGHGTPVTGSE